MSGAGETYGGHTPRSSQSRPRPIESGHPGRLSRAGRRQLRRRRLAGLVRLAVFLLLIFVAVWAGVRVAHAGEDPTLYSGTPYTVRAGDTLWNIAAVRYGSGTDLRSAVYDIRGANSLGSSTLQPGQTLMLPYRGD